MSTDFSFSEDTFGFIIEGVMNKEAMDTLLNEIKTKIQENEKINLYIEVSNIEKFTLNAIISGINLQIEKSHKFRRIALVSDRKWLQNLAQTVSLFTSSKIKCFTSEKRIDAMSWIAQN